VWLDREPHLENLPLAQAQSNRAPKGRQHDFRDAHRLRRRWLASELMLSFVPEPEQRAWRRRTRGRLQLVRERLRLPNQVVALRQEARIKLSSVVSDWLGVSGRRILEALSQGETDAVKLAELGHDRLKCTPEQLADALRGSPEPSHRALLKLHLERLKWLDRQIDQLSQRSATAPKQYQDAVVRPKYPDLASSRRSCGSPKWGWTRRPSLRRASWPPGAGPAREAMGSPRRILARVAPRETGRCGVCWPRRRRRPR
jgi:hypothetical protein